MKKRERERESSAMPSFVQVQSLGVCLAALCIWLQPLDLGSVETSYGEAIGADPFGTGAASDA